jgi:hypothetical protein
VKAHFSWFVRSFRVALVILMGVLMLGTSAVLIQAGPPVSLTASQNPVIIPNGQSAGQFTLAWNTGTGAAGELWASTNGGPDAGPYAVPVSGSYVQPINSGETLLFKLYTPKKEKMLASLTVTTVHPDGSCAKECFKLVAVEPHGTFANFHIITTNPVKVILEAHEDGQGVASSTFNLVSATDWHTTLLNLKPNTKYIYNATATDGSNNTKISTGQFTTLRRQVQVNFTDIHVIDDSDFASAGDLTFAFGVNGKWSANKFGEMQINTGTTVHPNHIETITDAPDGLTLAVHGVDDDCDFAQLCVKGIPTNDDPGGSNDEMDWATAKAKTDVAVIGLGEEFTDSLTFQTTQFSLKFSVTATYAVTYVP